MIAGIKGNLDYIGPDWVIVAVAGISVKLSVPSSTIENLGGIGSKVDRAVGTTPGCTTKRRPFTPSTMLA